MDILNKQIDLHPHFLDLLFTYKSKVSSVFADVLGLHEISHIAISCINEQNQLSTFSSTPALEFNLFNTILWRFDKTYQPNWYQLCSQSPWQALYEQSRYDELYYIKQAKHQYPLGISLATKHRDNHIVYSLASHRNCLATQALFTQQQDNFYKIGEYCSNALLPLLLQDEKLP